MNEDIKIGDRVSYSGEGKVTNKGSHGTDVLDDDGYMSMVSPEMPLTKVVPPEPAKPQVGDRVRIVVEGEVWYVGMQGRVYIVNPAGDDYSLASFHHSVLTADQIREVRWPRGTVLRHQDGERIMLLASGQWITDGGYRLTFAELVVSRTVVYLPVR